MAGGALAQNITHNRSEVELGYSMMEFDAGSTDGINSDILSIEGRTDFSLSGGLGVQVDIGFTDNELSSLGATVTTDVLNIAAHPYFEFTPAARAGVFVEYSDTGIEELEVNPTSVHYGLEAMLAPIENVSVELFAGIGRYDVGSDDPLDSTVFGAEAVYGFMPNFGAHIRYATEKLDFSVLPEPNLSEFALGLDYYGDGFGTNVPFVVTAEYSKQDILSISDDRFGIGLTLAIGGGTDSGSRRLYSDRTLFPEHAFYGAFSPVIIVP